MRKRERGSVTLWSVVSMIGFLAVVGLVVDGGAQLRATQRADQVAREAARSAAQAISGDPVLGRQGLIDRREAVPAVAAYLKAADVPGASSIMDQQVQVTTYVTYRPIFLSAFGISQVTVRGHGQARIARAYEGTER